MKRKGWITALTGVAVLGVISPMLMESASNPCHALEKVGVRTVSTGDYGMFTQLGGNWVSDNFSRGSVAEAAVRARFPKYPAQATCLVVYYHAVWGKD